jgi:hypothetical protein
MSCIVGGSIICEEYVNTTGCLNTVFSVFTSRILATDL